MIAWRVSPYDIDYADEEDENKKLWILLKQFDLLKNIY